MRERWFGATGRKVPAVVLEGTIALDDALTALAGIDERRSRVVELRYFGGLSVEDTAEVLQVSPDTVMRDWRLARGFLLRELAGPQPGQA